MKSFSKSVLIWPVCIAATVALAALALADAPSDRDPQGANIRAAPNATAPVIGHLPPAAMVRDLGEIEGAEFDVMGSRDGWLLIRNAEFGDDVYFVGPGWISGRLVGTTINDSNMRAGPGGDARLTLSLLDDAKGWGAGSYTVVQIHGCSGAFADVSVRDPDGKVARGWVTRLCSAQLTTCS